MTEADVVMTSLPYAHTWNEAAQDILVPAARKGQIIIDLGNNTEEKNILDPSLSETVRSSQR